MKRRRLSSGEAALWRKATRDVAPLRGPLPGLPAGDPPALSVGETREEEMRPVRSGRGKTGRDLAPLEPAHAKRGRKPAPASAFAAGDPKLDKKARRGRIEIERALDLHGLRQEPARRALGAFLVKASQEGCRCVLVITGKGAPSERDPQPADGEPRGVIRRRFSEWIDEEPLRGLIARAAPAKQADGGGGAFYVFLKGRPPS